MAYNGFQLALLYPHPAFNKEFLCAGFTRLRGNQGFYLYKPVKTAGDATRYKNINLRALAFDNRTALHYLMRSVFLRAGSSVGRACDF